MKRTFFGLLLCLSGSVGCTQMLVPAGDMEAKMRGSSAAPPVPIQAEQVTPQTAHKLSQALGEELDRDDSRDQLGAAPPATK